MKTKMKQKKQLKAGDIIRDAGKVVLIINKSRSAVGRYRVDGLQNGGHEWGALWGGRLPEKEGNKKVEYLGRNAPLFDALCDIKTGDEIDGRQYDIKDIQAGQVILLNDKRRLVLKSTWVGSSFGFTTCDENGEVEYTEFDDFDEFIIVIKHTDAFDFFGDQK